MWTTVEFTQYNNLLLNAHKQHAHTYMHIYIFFSYYLQMLKSYFHIIPIVLTNSNYFHASLICCSIDWPTIIATSKQVFRRSELRDLYNESMHAISEGNNWSLRFIDGWRISDITCALFAQYSYACNILHAIYKIYSTIAGYFYLEI